MGKHLTAVCPGVRRGEKVGNVRGYARWVKRANRTDNGQRVGARDKKSPRQR